MPFTPPTQNPGDLIKSSDWNDAMTAIVQLFEKLDQATGHQHTGAFEDAPPIDTAGLADGAVTTARLADAAVTAAKIAAGVIPELGVTVTPGMTHGQTIPVPGGFIAGECVFFAFMKYVTPSAMSSGGLLWCQANNDGLLTVLPQAVFTDGIPTDGLVATGVALAKRGGW